MLTSIAPTTFSRINLKFSARIIGYKSQFEVIPERSNKNIMLLDSGKYFAMKHVKIKDLAKKKKLAKFKVTHVS